MIEQDNTFRISSRFWLHVHLWLMCEVQYTYSGTSHNGPSKDNVDNLWQASNLRVPNWLPYNLLTETYLKVITYLPASNNNQLADSLAINTYNYLHVRATNYTHRCHTPSQYTLCNMYIYVEHSLVFPHVSTENKFSTLISQNCLLAMLATDHLRIALWLVPPVASRLPSKCTGGLEVNTPLDVAYCNTLSP
jgi:hypothetical protein